MRVSRAEAEKNRAHVVEVAGTEFRRHGFDGIGVADLMHAAGLTHGGFYKNFDSKDALAVEAMRRVLADAMAQMRARALRSDEPLRTALDIYLSAQHRDAPEAGCAVAALSQDAARGSPALRAAFAEGIEGYVALIAELAQVDRARAVAIYATMVGALSLARTVPDKALSDEILAAAKAEILAGR